MSDKKVIKVQFKDKKDPSVFNGHEFTYYSTVDLSVGDIIIVPTRYGNSVAQVARTDVKPSEIDKSIERYMLTITEIKRPKQQQRCRVCGCTQDRACPGGCYWVEPNLCSNCSDREPPERSD
jgi:hypothetical protein